MFDELYLNPLQRKAFNFSQVEFVIGFQPASGTARDTLFARCTTSDTVPIWSQTSFANIKIITSYRDRVDKRIAKPAIDTAIMPRYEVSVKYGVDLSQVGKTFQFKLSDVVNRKNVDSMFVYWRIPSGSNGARTGYCVHTGTIASDTGINGTILPFSLSVRKVGSTDPAYIRGVGCSRPIPSYSDMLMYTSETWQRRFGGPLPTSMENGSSDLNGWCPYLFMWDFVGIECSPFIDVIGGTDGSQDDYVFTITAQSSIDANLELHIAMRYNTAWKLSGKIPVEVSL